MIRKLLTLFRSSNFSYDYDYKPIWYADAEQTKETRLSDDFGDGDHWAAWSLDCENSYQKIALYKNVGYDLRYLYHDWANAPGLDLLYLGIDENYQSLVDLYQNSKMESFSFCINDEV
jgi:hypothetical protein